MEFNKRRILIIWIIHIHHFVDNVAGPLTGCYTSLLYCVCRFCPLKRSATLKMKNHIKVLDTSHSYLNLTPTASFQFTCWPWGPTLKYTPSKSPTNGHLRLKSEVFPLIPGCQWWPQWSEKAQIQEQRGSPWITSECSPDMLLYQLMNTARNHELCF